VQRVRLIQRLVSEQSFAAAERVLAQVLAAPAEDEDALWTRLRLEFEFLNSLPRREEAQEARRVAVGTEIVRRFADDATDEIRAEVLLIGATLEVSDGPSAARWLRATRQRPDFEQLIGFDKVREAVELMEKMVVEDATERPIGPLNEDNEEILALLRWWSEPGAPIPARVTGMQLPPPGAVDPVIQDESDANEVILVATALASISRYGDALNCIRAVARFTDANGLDMAHALAKIIEGELLVFVDRVAEAADCLWFGALELRQLGRLDASTQAFLELARLGASHPELDEILADRVNPDEDGPPGSRIVAVATAARGIATEVGDHLGKWTAELLTAQILFKLGRVKEAHLAVNALTPPPNGPTVDFARAQLALARARIQFGAEGTKAGRRELAAAERIPATKRPWFEWQLHAMRAEIEVSDGNLGEAWTASQRALSGMRALRAIVGDERDRASWSASRGDAWTRALRIAAWRDRPHDALAVIEDAKSTHLARLVRAQAASSPDPETAALIRDTMNRLAASANGEGELGRHALDRAHRESQELLRQVRMRDAHLAAVLDPPTMDDDALHRLRDTVGDFMLIDYLDANGDSIWRVTATADGAVEVRELELLDNHRQTLDHLDASKDAAHVEQWMRSTGAREALDDLGRFLFVGLKPESDWPSQLVISPSGRLGNVPWSVLKLNGDAAIEHFAVTLVPSLMLSLALNSTAGTAPPFMFCCDPTGELHGVSEQRDALSALLPGMRVIEGANAGLSGLADISNSGELAVANALIWAGHGVTHPEEPLASGLLLGDGAIVTAGGIAALSLPSAVELWTCNSGAERRLNFDEQLGMVAACVRAGASTVLASLWPLDDDVISDLSTSYHERLIAGDAPAEALRQAQLANRPRLTESVWAAVNVWGVTETQSLPASPPPVAGQRPTRSPDAPPAVALGKERLRPPVGATGPFAPPVPPLRDLDDQFETALESASKLAHRIGSRCMGTGHLLWALLPDRTIGPTMSDAGVFSVRVEALISHLLATHNLPEQRDGPNGGQSQVLEALMLDVHGQGTTSPREILSALLDVDDSDARVVVRYCGIDAAQLIGWLNGAQIPGPAKWISYAPSAAALKEANIAEVYEQAAAHMTADAWALDPWPRRWLRLVAERARDVERGNAGRLASSRSKTLLTADKQRASKAGAGLVPQLARVAFAHGKARSLSATGQDDAKEPQYVLAVAACRTALALAQAHGLLSMQAQCHGLLGDLLRTTDRDAARIHARLGCDTAKLLGDQSLFAFLLVTLANAIAGDDPRSGSFKPDGYDIYHEHYERAAAILSRLGDRQSSDMLLSTLKRVRCSIEAQTTEPNNPASGEQAHPQPDEVDNSLPPQLGQSD
jgi:CHAT domain-containing protein